MQEDLNSMVEQMDNDTDYYDATYHLEQIKEKTEQESKIGHWIDASVFDINDTTIEQLQSCTCSNCKKILTTPYMYYFDVYNYCPYCGKKMESEE